MSEQFSYSPDVVGPKRGTLVARKQRPIKNWFMLQVWRLQQVSQIVTLAMLTATLSGIIWGYVKYRGGIFSNSIFGILIIAVVIGLVVWSFAIFWDVRLKLWKDQMHVLIEKNPYTHEKMSPKELFTYIITWIPIMENLSKSDPKMADSLKILKDWIDKEIERDPHLVDDVKEIMDHIGSTRYDIIGKAAK